MSTVVSLPGTRRFSLRAVHVLWAVFGLMTLLVLIRRESTLLDPHSFLRLRYAPIPWLMLLHGIPGATALLLGFFQFSAFLRMRYRKMHRILGRVYVLCALVSAPTALFVSHALPIPTLFAASGVQAFGWIFCTGTALYCVRSGRIREHREWMMRSYPFAMVFIVARVVGFIPAVQRLGMVGHEEVVWVTCSLAGILPSFLIALQNMPAARRPGRVQSAG